MGPMSGIRPLLKKKKRAMTLCLSACVGCTLCAESCFLFMSNGKDPQFIPSYKVLNTVGTIYRKKGEVAPKELVEMERLLWKNCVLCGRCSCPVGIHLPSMLAFARSVLRSAGLDGMAEYHPEIPKNQG
jgi:Fe-S oxidoreductase